jgi:hypothetical protein
MEEGPWNVGSLSSIGGGGTVMHGDWSQKSLGQTILELPALTKLATDLRYVHGRVSSGDVQQVLFSINGDIPTIAALHGEYI